MTILKKSRKSSKWFLKIPNRSNIVISLADYRCFEVLSASRDFLFLILVLGGSVSKDSDGKISFSFGVTGIIDKINGLVNDHKNRQLIDAEIKIKEAEARKIDAETEQIKSSLLSTPTAQQIHEGTTNLSEPMNTLQQIAEHNNINISA